MNLSPGAHIGPYEIVSPFGEGRMGVVYRARDPRLDRLVAIKLLSLSSTDDRQAHLHDVILALGSVPLDVLEERMAQFIKDGGEPQGHAGRPRF